ncbi:MAG: hypothetical protein LC750_09875, partial [Actinobacteria bacterium]|nr:hypothetical protein [Actinomycetota bacterium]
MRKILVVVTVLTGACVSVDATRIRKDLYVVNVRGNAFGGQGEAIAAANERANELCPGGYEIQDSAAGSSSAYFRTSYGYQQVRKPEVTIVVRCGGPESESRTSQGFWCTARPDGFGSCAGGDRGPGA